MIDYFCRWNNVTEAKQDAYRLRQYFGQDDGVNITNWATYQFLPDVKAWRPSLDVTNPDGSVTHTYITGWMGILALPNQVSVILNDSSLAFALNRDGPPYIIRNNIGGIITDIAVSPIFCGSHYPIGGYN